MGDSPTENLMGHDINLKTSTTWATDSKEDESLYRGSIGGVESDIPDTGETSYRTTASNDSLTFVKNSYQNSEDTSLGKVTAPLLAYSKSADVVLESEAIAEVAARPGVSGQRENEGRGKVTEQQLTKSVIQSILSTLGNKFMFQRAVGPTPSREEPTVSPTASGDSSGGKSLVSMFSMSWLSGAARAQESSPKQVPVASSEASTTSCRSSASSTSGGQDNTPPQVSASRSDSSAARHSVAMIEKAGSCIHILQQILQAHHSKGREDEEDAAVFQKVVKELRLQLTNAEMMIAEIAPLVAREKAGSFLHILQQILQTRHEQDAAVFQEVLKGLRLQVTVAEMMIAAIAPFVAKKRPNPQLVGTLELMTTNLLELREVLQVGPKYGGMFSQLDVQAAFIDARNRLKEARYAASKLGPITVNSDK